MMLALALLAQTATLPEGNLHAARSCAAIELRSVGNPPSVSDLARHLYFMLLAARETRGTARLLDHVPDEQAVIQLRVTAETDDMTLQAACHSRFPQIDATRVTLPPDPFKRGVLCVSAASEVAGLANSLHDQAQTQRWDALAHRLLRSPGMTNADYRKRGVTSSEGAKTYSDQLIQESLDLGNVLAVASSCEAAYPG